jgi:hypothetical protein
VISARSDCNTMCNLQQKGKSQVILVEDLRKTLEAGWPSWEEAEG